VQVQFAPNALSAFGNACGLTTTCSITSVTSNSGALVAASDYVITGPLSLKLKAAGNGGHAQTYIVGVTCTDALFSGRKK
jgi:hypothetical protein